MSDGQTFAIPGVPRRFVRRPRLYDAVSQAAAGQLTIVRATAGYGKTLLLADWASTRDPGESNLVWLNVDDSSSTAPSFWARVLQTIVDAGIATERSPLANTVASGLGAAELLTVLLRGFTTLTRPLLLVLDDYQRVRDDEVHAHLLWLLERTNMLRLIVSTRAAGPLETVEVLTRFDPEVIDDNDLRFTAEETNAMVEAFAVPLSDAEVRELDRAVAGWPLGIRTVLVDLGLSKDTLGHALEKLTNTLLHNYASTEFLTSLSDSQVLGDVLRTSLPDSLTEELAILLGGSPATLDALDLMATEGLGQWKRGGTGRVFEYQPVVRRSLETELIRRSPDDVAALRRSLAGWLNENARPLEAARQCLITSDWPLLVEVCKRHFGLIVQYYVVEFREMLESIPNSRMRREPLLVVLLALLGNATDPSPTKRISSLLTFTMSYVGSKLGTQDPVEEIWLALALMAGHRLSGNYDRALTSSQRVMELVDVLPLERAEELAGIYPTMCTQVGTSYIYADRAHEALPMLEQATLRGNGWRALHGKSLTALVEALNGDVVDAAQSVVEGTSWSRPQGSRGSYPAAGLHLAEAFLALEQFDPEGARAALTPLDLHAATIEHWPFLLRVQGIARLQQGRGFSGVAELNQEIAARKTRKTSAAMYALLAATASDLLLAEGQPARAQRALAKYGTARGAAAARARVALALGMPQLALTEVQDLIWPDTHIPRLQSEALLTSAVALAQLGEAQRAGESLRHGLDVLDAVELRLPLMMVPRNALLSLTSGRERDELEERLTEIPDVFGQPNRASELSARERLVLSQLAQGNRVEDIAAALFVSPNTVKTQLRSIYRKLGASSRDQAIVLGRAQGLLHEE